ncbi:hypothetical protein F4825DRAFT_440936 [Nemania diffusa]|nr:hypothetical protein F4825DRAFT_440936 [Nemania diffusa]
MESHYFMQPLLAFGWLVNFRGRNKNPEARMRKTPAKQNIAHTSFTMEFIADSITPFTDGDLRRVFAYSEAPASVITLLKSQTKLVEKECKTEDDWDLVIKKILPSVSKKDGDSGFVLLIAPYIPRKHRTRSKSSPGRNEDEKSSQIDGETPALESEEPPAHGGQRQTRVLPFSQDIFRRLSEAFYTHRSISPAINRADVPLFSHEDLSMLDGQHRIKARVYNCRSTNAWGGDLAMTVTHFPQRRLSFGILFGCASPQKKYILQRLSFASRESAHPLLLPGIFAELEKKRHHEIFGSQVDRLESIIPESDMEGLLKQIQSGAYSNGQDKRTVYLDMLHLKHGLTTWSHQLNKMREHAQNLSYEHLEVSVSDQITSQGIAKPWKRYISDDEYDLQSPTDSATGGLQTDQNSTPCQDTTTRTDVQIIKRIDSILEDYSDKIRECQTRFDGLTMTTQLFQGETSVTLALAASRDSRHMRTIALVTMVFLPGTFFATVFSMTFFNWQAGDGESTVSPLLWIYIAFSVISTAATLLGYYYCVGLRSKKALNSSDSAEV